MNFNQWLFNQRHRDDPVGDLAGDASRDKRWPTGQRIQERYMSSVNVRACQEAKDALLEAWREYYEQIQP